MLTFGILLYGVTFIQRWWILRRMLGVVKSEAVARLLENDPGQFDQQGEERIVTLLFADIRNFTDFSEKHSAQEVVRLLNAYFTAVVPILERHGGTLNCYMGDGMMVSFGVPVFRSDHALQAVRAAVEMVSAVHRLKERWAELGFAGLRIGVGIHTGRVVAGSVGSPGRQDYTAIGDAVNTASRIETKNKDFGTEILISAETFRDLPSKERQALGCAETGRTAAVKGKQQELTLHAVSVADA
jgi:adenylate cyclase